MSSSSKPRIYRYDDFYELWVYPTKVKVRSYCRHVENGQFTTIWEDAGYYKFKLYNKNMRLHQFVALLTLGKRPDNLVVNHVDGNKSNNQPSNLEYVTQAENIAHAIRMGLHICTRPEELSTFKDGRTRNLKKYKADWYMANREQLAKRQKERRNLNKVKDL